MVFSGTFRAVTFLWSDTGLVLVLFERGILQFFISLLIREPRSLYLLVVGSFVVPPCVIFVYGLFYYDMKCSVKSKYKRYMKLCFQYVSLNSKVELGNGLFLCT